MVAAAIIGSAVVSGAASSYAANQASRAGNNAAAASNAANEAALAQNQTQFEASQRLQAQLMGQQLGMQQSIANQQIAESRNQFNAVREVLTPFITAGNSALGPLQQYQSTGLQAMQGQRDLIGLNGGGSQNSAIQGLSNSPEMAAYLQQGENAMLQNASATGGLRGGNTQAAMAQFRPQLLAGLISQQYDRLGGLAGVGANTSSMLYQSGQSAAAGVGNAGMQVASQVGSALSGYSQGVGNAFSQSGAAQQSNMANMGAAYNQYYNNQGAINSGNALAQGNANIAMANGISNSVSGALGSYATLQAMRGSQNPGTAGLGSINTGGQNSYSLASGYQNGGQGLR